ncbi:hypothetical protein HB364_06260 [Pseudoflavitalea sp. X16]|uniref:RDD family protein n=1 Tax=Paraflavitalea devenefica TaxID=2716334 RepID=UPI00141EBCBC|nr:RDD family protein [Paraflavitalea devenefica]NII24671.1 hypothetical protein [Paraflavitalea devenefica]
MKNKEKYAAVILLSVLQVYNIVRSFEYFKTYFTNLGNSFRYGNGLNTIQTTMYILFVLLDLVLITLFFASTGRYQDKVYKLLRYLFLVTFFLYIPYTIYAYTSGNVYFQSFTLLQKILQITSVLANIACAVLFLRAKPQTQPLAINLAEYELVNYTSMGHRFVHHLLDMLFIVPVFLFWREVLYVRNEYMLELLFLLVYLVYCFLSEAVFRQTLGKIATNSCVTSNGPDLTAGRVLLRTLARLIPFDRASFLFRANWHDKTTYTSVVYIDTWEKVFEDSNPEDTAATSK